jgi:hypothetical protein
MPYNYLITSADINDYKLIADSVNDERIKPFIKEAQDFDLKEQLGYAFFSDIFTNYVNISFVINVTGIVNGPFVIGNAITGNNGGTGKISAVGLTTVTVIQPVGNWRYATAVSSGTNTTADVASFVFNKYYKLMYGENYTDYLLLPVEFEGLRAALVYWSFARFIEKQQETITSHSFVRKTNQYSEPVSNSAIAARITQARNGAVAYYQAVEKYLYDIERSSPGTFPIWVKTKQYGTRQRGGMRIGSADRFKNHDTVKGHDSLDTDFNYNFPNSGQ